MALSKYRTEVASSSSLAPLRGSAVGWWILWSRRVRQGSGESGRVRSAGTERVLLDWALVQYELTMVNLVIEGLKNPSGVKSSAKTSFGLKKYATRVTVAKNELKGQKATGGFVIRQPWGEQEVYK